MRKEYEEALASMIQKTDDDPNKEAIPTEKAEPNLNKIKPKRKSLGLALGAGSARGFAHLGVLEVLEDNNIGIDYICGSSMGSVIGGIYACNTNIRMLCKIVPLLRERDFFDVVVPTHGGFIRGERFRKLISIFTKQCTFEETEIPFSCVAVDLMHGDLVVLDEGSLDDAIRASIAIPGIMEPHSWKDKTLVDGGVILRVPSRIARSMGADVVIGVDVGYRGETLQSMPNNLVDYLFVSTDIMAWTAAQYQESEADLMIVPKTRDFDPNSFRDFEALVDAGRLAAQEALPEIVRLLGRDGETNVDMDAASKNKVTLRKKS